MAKARIKESSRLLEALPDGPNGEKVFKVALITEGLGNKRNMNFYGPEAIASAVKVYEGKSCYIDHQSSDEEESLPERSVRDKAGYYKNLTAITMEGSPACIGELHCDLSESGRFLAEKIQSALNYKKEFPDNDREYVGFSVNGDGDAEEREIEVSGEKVTVNYVLAFTEESESCDLVTSPARGGKAMSVIRESASENKLKENVMKKKIRKVLETAFSKITESAKKLTDDAKKPLLEVAKMLTEALKTVEAEDETNESEAEMIDKMLARKEGESEADHTARKEAFGKMIADKIGGEPPATAHAEPDGDEPPAQESNRKPLTADELERNTMAVKSLIKESGLPEDCYSDAKISALARMPFGKAKTTIENDSKLAASILRESGIEPVASLRRVAKETGSRKAAFTESFRTEGN